MLCGTGTGTTGNTIKDYGLICLWRGKTPNPPVCRTCSHFSDSPWLASDLLFRSYYFSYVCINFMHNHLLISFPGHIHSICGNLYCKLHCGQASAVLHDMTMLVGDTESQAYKLLACFASTSLFTIYLLIHNTLAG